MKARKRIVGATTIIGLLPLAAVTAFLASAVVSARARQAPPAGVVDSTAEFATAGQRPYTPDSPWNTPIPANAVADTYSDAMVATIAANGPLRSDPTQYAFPLYFADSTAPRVTLTCAGAVSTNNLDGTRTLGGGHLAGVPIPPGTMASAGTDAQVIVIDVSTGDEYDIWQFEPPSSCRNVTRYVQGVYRSAVETRYASRGAGVPYFAGLVRPWEIAQGHIDHALAFGYPMTRRGRCVWPASKSDGNQPGAAIPEGARIQLDPNLDVDAIPGLSVEGRIIARALQVYGAFLIDTSGSNKLYLESAVTATWNGAGNTVVPQAAPGQGSVGRPPAGSFVGTAVRRPGATGSSGPLPQAAPSAFTVNATTVSAIPIDRLRVLQLPSAYWSGGYSPTHGDCVQ